MYAIRSYYEDGKDRALCFLGNPEKTHNLFHWYDMTLSPEISGLIIYGGGLGQFENEEELSFFLERFKSKPRITSYNVCYTKLLRPAMDRRQHRVADQLFGEGQRRGELVAAPVEADAEEA